MASHNELGKKGEELAVKHLLDKGYEILDRNWRFNRGEIDIIAKTGNTLVIVEVKTRENDYAGPPQDAVSISKQRSIVRTANEYIVSKDIDLETRFDIIGIILNSKRQEVIHIEDAFSPLWK